MRAQSATAVFPRRMQSPSIEQQMLERPRVLRGMSSSTRVILAIAPAGYGKTVAAQQWVKRDGRDAAWLTINLLDDSPPAFWHDLIAAIRYLRPEVDAEPERLLDEHGPDDPRFLASLVRQIESNQRRGVLVLDEISRLTDRGVLDGLSLLVDRVGASIQLIMMGRAEPRLPVARWRSLGWLCELDQALLRFTDIEAIAAAEAWSLARMPTSTVVALARRTEGWPAGLRLALMTVRDDPDPESASARLAGPGSPLAAYLAAEVLEQLSPEELDVALALSVLDDFDAERCAELLGPGALPVARALQRRGLLLTEVIGGRLRFHTLLRDVLRDELRWRDPPRRVELHRRAAQICRERGDLNGAHRHLASVLGRLGTSDLIVGPALAMTTFGDHGGLCQMMRSLPSDMRVDCADLAYDVATGWVLAGDLVETSRWCDRGDELADDEDSSAAARSQMIRGAAALLSCDLDVALAHAEALRAAARIGGDRVEFERFAAIAARVHLALGRVDDALGWVERLRGVTEPPEWAAVTVPAIEAWVAWDAGDLRVADELAERAMARASVGGTRHNQSVFDATAIAASCRLGQGDLAGAQALADVVAQAARVLATPWNRLRAGLLQAEVRRLQRGPRAAMDVIAETRRAPGLDTALPFVRRELDFAEATALIELGAIAPASRLLEAHPDCSRKRLLLARAASRYETVTTVEETLGLRNGWNLPAQLEADVLLARANSANGSRLLADALTTACATGWVLPFLGHGQAIEDFIAAQPLDRLHPKLLAAFAARRAGAPPTELRAELTPRELTILHLLPTHLSYAEIAARLYLSVNTVKTNLKSLYRKLGAASRSEAVDTATRAGIG